MTDFFATVTKADARQDAPQIIPELFPTPAVTACVCGDFGNAPEPYLDVTGKPRKLMDGEVTCVRCGRKCSEAKEAFEPIPIAATTPARAQSTRILAVDPGTEKSGWCLFDGGVVKDSGVESNAQLLTNLKDRGHFDPDHLAIEMIASYGMAVGREVFETCVWIGRFQQAWHKPDETMLVYRKDVKLHLCGTSKAKDPNIRQALLDMFPRTGGGKTPQIGTKGQPGPLYGVSSHAWAALGVAVTAAHRINNKA